MIKDYNADINRWIISQCNPLEKRGIVGGARERDRSRARLNPKSARWLISIKPNYYLRLGSVWHVIQKQLFFFLYFIIFFFFVLFYGCGQQRLPALGRVYQIELADVDRNKKERKSNGKHALEIVLEHSNITQQSCLFSNTEFKLNFISTSIHNR